MFGTFNVFDHGLWERMLAGSSVDHAKWMRARAEHHPVGTCRVCGGHMWPREPAEVGEYRRTDYEAECKQGHTILAPGGRVYRRSAARSERQRAAQPAKA